MFNALLGGGEKDRAFPHYAIDYFYQIREQYELTVQQNPAYVLPPAIVAIFKRVDTAVDTATDDMTRRKALRESVQWADVFALETAMIYALDDAHVGSALWSMRMRFREVAGADEYDEYLRSAISDASKPAAIIRADLLSLSGRMRYLYTFTPTVEAQRNRVSRSVALLTLLVVAVFIALFLWQGKADFQFADLQALLLVVFFGALGGFISIQQRLQQTTTVDPLFKELELAKSGVDALAAPLLGAIFAVILYLVFISSFVSGDLIPNFACPDPHKTGDNFKDFVLCAIPGSASAWGKLLVWAFIAGFAERFVPDVLTRLASSGEGGTSARVSTAVSSATVSDAGPKSKAAADVEKPAKPE